MDILQVLKIRQEIQNKIVSENLVGLTDFFADIVRESDEKDTESQEETV
jgi:hypothetical protein